jgi:heptosyltransferase-2
VNRVVIFAPNWLGDAVMALPAIGDIRRGSPGATVSVAARASVAPLFRMAREVDEVIEIGDRHPFLNAGPPAVSFEAAILLPNSFRSALAARRAGVPERWGYRTDCRGPLLTRAIDRPAAGTHQVEYYRHLVRALGFPNHQGEPRLEVSPELRAAAVRVLERAGWDRQTPLVALAPGAAYGSARRWPPDHFAALARALAGDGIRPVLVGSAADLPTGRKIELALGDSTIALNLIGLTDLPTLTGVLVSTRELVANDSGAMHLGAALGVPVTAVFGPTDERITGPRASPAQPIVVLTNPVWCRPCRFRACPIGHGCMRGIRVETVLEAARRML